VAAFIGSPSMNLVEAAVDGSTLRFGSTALDLPASSVPAAGNGRVILGIRPTDFEHGDGADAHLPRVRITPEVVEDLGSEQHVIFTIDAPPVAAESVLAAADVEDEDEGKLFADVERSSFTACLDARRRVVPGSDLELAVDPARLHFFEPASGEALQRTAAAVVA
jgi:multiple sugar transport system ATP-binding protein